MKDYTHVKYNERRFFKDLLLFDTCKKKNGKLNLSEISRQTGRNINTVKKEINRFTNIEDYNSHEAHDDYYKNDRSVFKKYLHLQKNNRTKKRPDNRGKLNERFKSIWDFENKESNVGWFEWIQ